MKIRMDVHEYGSGRSIAQRPVRVMSAESNQGGVDVPHVRGEVQIRTNLEQEKTLGEALAIVQMSQSLIQRALEISSRLRAIASRAITTGSIDSPELSRAISDASASFAVHGESAPVAAPSPVETQPSTELKELIGITRDMERGTLPENERFDKLDRALIEKNDAALIKQEEMMHSLGKLMPQGQWLDEKKVQAVLSDTGRKIEDNPSGGLMSHNRVRPESVIRLVG